MIVSTEVKQEAKVVGLPEIKTVTKTVDCKQKIADIRREQKINLLVELFLIFNDVQ